MASDAAAVEPGGLWGGLLAQLLKKPSQEQIVLLITTALPVKQIAQQVGYPDADFFCRIFKKKAGLTPKEYRSRYTRI